MVNVILDEAKAREIDNEEKNKFRSDWLSKTIKVKHDNKDLEFSCVDDIKKIDVGGKVMCMLCTDTIYYGKRGFAAILAHLKRSKHIEKVILKKSNYALPSNFFSAPSATSTSSEVSNRPVLQNVPLCDRISNAEALVLGVLAQHSLPFSMAETIIDVSRALCSDRKTLNHLSMKRASASYKMRFGLAKTFLHSTVENLKTTPFSLNIDEATSSNNIRVLSILCSYFSPTANKVVVEHLTSLSLTTVNSENLFNEIVKFFHNNKIPWENLMSLLMDSCNVMRGSKSGLETRIREKKAPHLLNVDGDSCHHIHNACKRFTKPFNMWLENLVKDISNDVKWSADIRSYMMEVCEIFQIKFVSPVTFISHRWMSCYDAALNFIYLLDAFTVIYYSFLNADDQVHYFSILCSIYLQRNVSASGRANIKDIQKKLSVKKLTDDGDKRKKRISKKLFCDRKHSRLIAHFYISVLPLLKKYILLFQTKEPLIQKVYDEQKQLLLDFLSCFVAPEQMSKNSVKELLDLNLSDKAIHLPPQRMFVGSNAQKLISNVLSNEIKENFLACAKQAFIDCGKYLQKTLPLTNKFLKCASAIDPTVRGHQITCQRLQQLASLLPTVLSSEQEEQFSLEIHQYQVDMMLPSPVDEQGKTVAVDSWWSTIFHMPKYFALSKIVKAVLSCFHGPQVEGSFNMMGDIIDKRSGRMQIETYSSIQTVKYKLLAEKKTAVEYFHKKDYLHQPVDGKLCYNLRASRKAYETELEEKKSSSLKQSLPPMNFKTFQILSSEEKSRLKHKRKLEIWLRR